jgi:hypothetical protein
MKNNKITITEKEASELKDKLEKIYNEIYPNISIDNFVGFTDDGIKYMFSIMLFHNRDHKEELLKTLEEYGYVYGYDFVSDDLLAKRINLDNIFHSEEVFKFSFNQYFISKYDLGESFLLLNGEPIEYE